MICVKYAAVILLLAHYYSFIINIIIFSRVCKIYCPSSASILIKS